MWRKTKKDNLVCWNLNKRMVYSKTDFDKLNNKDNKYSLYGDTIMYTESEDETTDLPSGVYRLLEISHQSYLVETPIDNTESILEFSMTAEILKDIEVFLNAREIYNQLKLKYKRGIFLYGPPGTGKTSLIHKVIKEIDLQNTLIIFIRDEMPIQFINALKDDQRIKLIIFEEFTNVLRNGEVNGDMLDFLDGESSLDNCFIIGSSNYPERLPMNITQRPGRFDRFYRVDTLDQYDVIKYLKHFNIDMNIKDSMAFLGKTIAELKELILIHKRDGKTLLQALEQVSQKRELSSVRFREASRDDDDYLL